MKRLWDVEELAEFWSLSFKELALLESKPQQTHLGLCAQLKYFQISGYFPKTKSEIPKTALHYLADQLELEDKTLANYDLEGRTGKRHRTEILQLLKIRRCGKSEREAMLAWLKLHVLPQESDLEALQTHAISWFQSQRIEPPAEKHLQRILLSAAHAYEQLFVKHITEHLEPDCIEQLDAMLLEDDLGSASFAELKADPGKIGLDTVLKEIDKLTLIRQPSLPHEFFESLHTKRLQKLRQRVANESAWELNRHPAPIRYGYLAIYCFLREREIIDGLIELVIQIVHRLTVRAERKVVKELVKDFQKVYGKNTLLFRIAEAAVGDPEGSIREVVFPVVNEETLKNLIKEYRSSGPAFHLQIHKIIRASYGHHYRRMLPCILDALEFRSNNSLHRPVLDALQWLHDTREDGKRFVALDEDIPIEDVIRPKWRDIVIEQDRQGRERINRINYEICILQTLRECLRCKEIWVVGADKFRNPDADLPQDFDANRESYYLDLGLTEDARQFVDELKSNLTDNLTQFNTTLPKNKLVRLLKQGKNRIVLTPLQEQAEPRTLSTLKQEIQSRWPMTGLLDVLKEADLRIGFTDQFQTTSQRESLDRDTLQRRLLLTLFGMGTNTGLKRVSSASEGHSYKELLHVRKKFVTKDALRKAIAQVVNATFAARHPGIWGEGTSACASDSKKFGAWDQNLMTEWHIRYQGRGVMIYWHVERKSTCVYSQLKRCSSSEVAAMIQGVLRHCTDMEIDRQYVDSHGQSEVAFAFCQLLGFDLLPRLKAIGSQKLYVPAEGSAAQFPNLAAILTRPIQWDIIEQQYDEMVKYTTALKQGTEPPRVLRRLFGLSSGRSLFIAFE